MSPAHTNHTLFLLSLADQENLPLHFSAAQVICTSTIEPSSALSHAFAVLRRGATLTGQVNQTQLLSEVHCSVWPRNTKETISVCQCVK